MELIESAKKLKRQRVLGDKYGTERLTSGEKRMDGCLSGYKLQELRDGGWGTQGN